MIPALAVLMAEPHTVGESVMLLITAARAAGGSDNITAIVFDVGGDRLVPVQGDDDLPTFREFDPQKEGDPALTDDLVRRAPARRADRAYPRPRSRRRSRSPGSTRCCVSRVGIRVPATALPIEDVEGPARRHLKRRGASTYVILAITVVACIIAWVLGGR